MQGLVDFLLNQVGVQGIFFVFTLILSYLFYKEKQDDKKEFKEREAIQLDREVRLSLQLANTVEALKELSENVKAISGNVEQLKFEVQEMKKG